MKRVSYGIVILCASIFLILTFVAGERRDAVRTVVTTAASKGLPDVAYDQLTGRYLVVWQEWTGRLAEDWDVRGRILDREGAPVGGVIDLASTGRNETHPKVAASVSGFWSVVWTTGGAIEACSVGPDGAVGGRRILTSSSTATLGHPDIRASADGGHYLVVWEEMDPPGPSTIKGAWIDRFSSERPPVLTIAASPRCALERPAMAAVSGRYFVAWEKRVGATRVDIEGRFIDAGTGLNEESLCGLLTIAADGALNLAPDVAGIPDTGSVTAVWSRRTGREAADIMRADIDGTGTVSPGVVTATENRSETQPSVSYFGLGRPVLVTYRSSPAGRPGESEIFARALGSGLMALPGEVLIDGSLGRSGHPATAWAVGEQGRGLIVWDTDEGAGLSLYSRDWLAADLPGAPPVVSIITPLDGQEVSESVQIQVTAESEGIIERVEFYVDGEKLGQDTEAPFSWIWESVGVPNGSHVIGAIAVDSSGLTGEDQVSVTVQNSIIALADHSISGTVTFEGSPMANVLMSGFPGDPRTDASGAYVAAVPAGWSGTVTPLTPGFTFSPASRTYSDVSGDLAAEDYTAVFVGGVDDAYEDNDDYSTAAIISLGTTQDLVLYDEDWFKFYVPSEDAGKDLRVRLWGTAFPDTTSPRDLDFGILDGSEKLLSFSLISNSDETAYICDVAEGWYYIAHTYVGLEGTVYAVTVELSDAFGLSYVSGHVTDDLAAPLEGVTVELYGVPFDWSVSRPLVITDASGFYKIGYVPGEYQVMFNLTDFNDTYDWTPDVNYLGEMYNYGEIIVLGSGATVEGIDAELTPGAAISGRITDGAGSPLNKAIAYAYMSGFRRAGAVYSDAEGDYVIDRLRTGNYAVLTRTPGGVGMINEWYDDLPTFASAEPIGASSGATTSGIDAALDEKDWGLITGRVTDSVGDPISGLRVMAGDPVGLVVLSAWTNENGEYCLERLPAGDWKIFFNAASILSPPCVSEYYPDKLRLNEGEAISVVAGEETAGIDASLADAGSISGTVSNNWGQLNVVAFDTASDLAFGIGASSAYAYGTTGYTINNLPPGTYKILARPNRQGDRLPRWYPDASTYSAAGTVTVVAGGTQSGIDITLSGGGGSISGQVTDGLGSGIPNIVVVAQEASKQTGYHSALTDADGNYTVLQIPVGQVKVFFNAEANQLGHNSEYYNDQSAHDTGDPVTVSEGMTTTGIDAVLTARPALTMYTSSLASGQLGVAYSQILEATGGRTFYRWTIISGTLPEGLTMDPRGEIAGTPTAVGTFPLTFQLTDSTSPQQIVTQELTLDVGAYSGPGYTITGHVVLGGSPLPGVVLSGLPGNPVTNSAGGYADVVPSGWTGTVTPNLAGHAFDPAARTYANVSASVADQDYSASPGYTISGSVTFNGEPQPNILMAGLPGDPYTDGSGSYAAAVTAGWTGTVTPTLAGFAFSPADRTYTDMSADATGQDYEASYVGGVDDEYEDNDDFASAAILPLGTTSGLVLRDEDWFKVYVPASEAGKDLRVRLWGTAYPDTTTRRDLDFYVLDGAGNALSVNISGSADETIYICDVSEGWYYIAHTYIGLVGTVYSLSAETNADFGLGYITGTIRDDDGYVVQGVAVELYGWPFDWDVSRPLIYTDASGRYKIGYTPGAYTVQFNVNVINDDLDWTPEANCLGETYNGGEVLNLIAGATLSDIDANLTPGGTITGRITDAAGNPLSMALAYAYAGDMRRASADYTDENGYYRMWRLRTGNYAVRFRAPGGSPLATEWYRDAATFGSALPVPVTAGETTANIDAALVEGGGIAGQVTNSLGEPLAHVSVVVYDDAGNALQAVYSGEGGDYLIGWLPAGTYRVYFNASFTGDPTAVSEYYPDKRLLAEAEGVIVTVGETTMGIDAQLALGGAITGQVTDASGLPLKGIGVHCFDTDSDFYAGATTDSEGGYTISNLAADQYKVRFRPSPGYWATVWWDGKTSFTDADTVTVSPGESVMDINAVLSADEFGTITGRVTDGVGAGIKGVSVAAQDATKAIAYYSTAATNSEGYYSLFSVPACQAKILFNPDSRYLNFVSEHYNDKEDHDSADAVAVTVGETASGIDAVLAARPALAVSTESLPAGELAVSYSSTLAASGGRTLYHWSLESGALPDGLSMNERGEITGVPTDQGTFAFTVRVKDSTYPQQSATRELSITVGPYTGIGYTISGTITLDSAPLPGVVLSGLPGDPVTNSLGGYAAVVPPDWSGTVTPTYEGHYFIPGSRTYANVNEGFADQDYAAIEGVAPTITVTSPNGGESWTAGSTYDVTWTSTDLTGDVTIDLYKGGVYQKTLGTADVSTGTFSWAISAAEAIGADYKIRIGQNGTYDESDGDFAVSPRIRVDFNSDGQEDILWRYQGEGTHQGLVLVWLMDQSESSAVALLGVDDIAMSETGLLAGQSVDPLSRTAKNGDVRQKRFAHSLRQSIVANGHKASYRPQRVPPSSVKTIMVGKTALIVEPKLSVRSATDDGRVIAAAARERVEEVDLGDILTMTDAADMTSVVGEGAMNIAAISRSSEVIIARVTDLAWEIAGTGDFNSDGKVDILWRYYGPGTYEGLNVIWHMDGITRLNEVIFSRVTDTNWRISGTGDFNGDGKTDILWRYHGTGTYEGLNVIWYMDGTTRLNEVIFSRVSDTNWRIAGTGDFNSDGKTDILWRYHGPGTYEGLNVIWHMDGTIRLNEVIFSRVTDTAWEIGGTGDFDADGKVDILWRYYGPGTYQGLNVIWYMDGTTRLKEEIFSRVSDTNWRIVNR